MKKTLFFCLTVILLIGICAAPVSAYEESRDWFTGERLLDVADVLDEDSENALCAKLDRISEKFEFDTALMLIDGANYTDIDNFAFTAYYDGKFGFNDSIDGCLLVIDLNAREWALFTDGRGLDVFTDDGIDYIGEQLTEYLAEDQYLQACELYAELCESFLVQAESGKPYDSSNLPVDFEEVALYILISLGIGLVIAFITVSVMKGQLKSVYSQATAHNYLKAGSLNVTESRDIYLYRTITRVARPKSNSGGRSSGGSIGSGRSGSGKF